MAKMHESTRFQQSLLIWLTTLSLVLSVLAILTSASAYNRSGKSLIQEIEEERQKENLTFEENTVLEKARADLEEVREDFISNHNYQLAEERIKNIRENLNQSLENPQGKSSETWINLHANLATLEEDLRMESAQAIDSFQGLLEDLEQDLKT